jgi:hypothetical protein
MTSNSPISDASPVAAVPDSFNANTLSDAWGARVFRMRDPDGFRLVISSER